MTEPTYTEADVREAIASKYHPDYHPDIANRIIDYLKRPKHDFAEGQVVVREEAHGYQLTIANKHEDLQFCRHLHMTELGPHVKALRDAVDDVDRHPVDYARKLLRDALAEFDAAVGESNDCKFIEMGIWE